MKVLKSHKSFDGLVQFWQHDSEVTKTKMNFSTFTPSGKTRGALIWLSGLTCTDENFISKAGAQKYLNDLGLMVICPDTSPRGLSLPGEHDTYDFGSGAGFYLNATTPGYADHYKMDDYINLEIYDILASHFQMTDRISIFGHSMGGHGALVLGLKNHKKYKSISAFSPIVNPSEVPWGIKAFNGYLGDNKEAWKSYDACELIKTGFKHQQPILIDQGLKDDFLNTQLQPEKFKALCEQNDQKVVLNLLDGYDHSYYFIASRIQSHLEFHAPFIY